jgi:hypothetical protein
MAYTTINKSTDYFNTKLWTGTGAENAISSVGFQPDFTWIKRREINSHRLFDAVRGATKFIESDSTAAEVTDAQELKSFDSDGFTLGTATKVNASGGTYASWNWKANGQGSSNTDGSINTTYTSANTTSGFSISQFTGTGSTATVGHGLGVAPKLIIAKALGTTSSWWVYHASVNSTNTDGYLVLNSDAATADDATIWTTTAPTSSVFSIGSAISAHDYVAYCFAEKQGFSKFGSYEGNGNADGSFIYTGFKPAFIMIKSYNTAARNWTIQDNKRSSVGGPNPNDKWLYANSSEAEANQAGNPMDFLSNGFKLRNTGSYQNQNAYIYMAFAEAPLVGSNNVPATAR